MLQITINNETKVHRAREKRIVLAKLTETEAPWTIDLSLKLETQLTQVFFCFVFCFLANNHQKCQQTEQGGHRG